MATCTDAQRLIAMSLGKIAVSRTQRGGANLHRSLLVSHVLHKARTAFMMENFQAMLHARQAQQQQYGQQEEQEQDQVVPEVVEQPPTAPATPLSQPQAQPSFPNPALREAQPQPGDSRPVSVQEEEDKENSPPSPAQRLEDCSNNKDSKDDKDVSCAKCTVKRRLASSPSPQQSQDIAPSSERDSEPPSCKRAKTDSVSRQQQSVSVCEKSEAEPMQTESVQISNLVHRFNSGLSGLLSCSNAQNCAGDSSSNPSSCATQIVDSVPRFQDSLSRPVIALTV